MAKYKKKLEEDIRCPLEYGLTIFWRKMEIPYYLRVVGKGKAPVQWASEGMQEQYVEVYGTKNIYTGTGAEVIFIGKLDFRKLSGAFIQGFDAFVHRTDSVG